MATDFEQASSCLNGVSLVLVVGRLGSHLKFISVSVNLLTQSAKLTA